MHAAYKPVIDALAQTIDNIDDALNQHGADNQIYTNLMSTRSKLCGIKRNLALATTSPTPKT